MADGPIWLIGCGNMGGAMLRRWLAVGMAPERFTVVTRSPAAVTPGVRALHALPVDEQPAVLLLAVKPQQLDAVAPTLAGVRPALLLSILAGVEEAALARRIDAGAIVRAMPNLPVAIGRGVVALDGAAADPAARAAAEALMRPLGLVEWVEAARFDAVTALAGSGPGFTYRWIDALADAGAALGLASEQALRIALATVQGSAMLAADADAPPATLADRVASSGGSTREGLNVLDRDAALRALVTDTLRAATRRNAELAAAARD
jgi:pyrroline-5-carboxylate reductase